MAGKGSKRRSGEDNQKFRENFPKMTDEYIPKWKRELMKLKEKQGD